MPGVMDVQIGTIGFKMLYNESNQCDVDTVVCLRKFGSPEPEVVHAMGHIVRPGDTVIDGGANMGFFTMVLAKLVGPNGKVIAVEPGKNNLWELESNIALNDLGNVSIVPKPLWSKHERLPFYLAPHGGWNSLSKVDGYDKVVELETVMLSDLTTGPPRLIKLDIEGAEVEVLRDVRRGTPFIICEMNWKALERMGDSQESLRETMQGHGYEMFLLRPDGLLPFHVPRNTKVVTEVEALNVMFSTPKLVGSVWKEIEIIPGPDK